MMPTTMPEQLDENDDVRDLAAMLFEHIETQINRADTKAGLILAADTLFATTVAALSKGVVLNLFDSALPILNRVAALFAILMFVALLASAFSALMVARPVLRVRDGGNTPFYFGHIVRLSHQDFYDKFCCQSPEQMRESILTEVYAIARIANQKFVRVRTSLDFLIGALSLWAVIQVVMAFTR